MAHACRTRVDPATLPKLFRRTRYEGGATLRISVPRLVRAFSHPFVGSGCFNCTQCINWSISKLQLQRCDISIPLTAQSVLTACTWCELKVNTCIMLILILLCLLYALGATFSHNNVGLSRTESYLQISHQDIPTLQPSTKV